MAEFSIREFLRDQKTLLVHFSTPMTRHPEKPFPVDIQTALTLQGEPLCFSTVQVRDKGPFDAEIKPGEANAGGCVGMVVDIQDDSSILSVCPDDGGSYLDAKTGKWVAAGDNPSPETCSSSLDDRTSHNEWGVQNFIPVGLFVFFPIHVRLVKDELEQRMDFDTVLSHFQAEKFFTIHEGKFCEHKDGGWTPVTYDEIIKP